MQTLILAKSINEANRYAKAVGLPRFTYRAVRNAGSIRGIRNTEVHLLSTFLERLDRHAIMAALRNARTLEVYYVDVADFDLSPKPVDQGDGMGEQLTIDDLEPSNTLETILEPEGWEPPKTLDAMQILRLAANPDRRAADIISPSARDLEVAYRYNALLDAAAEEDSEQTAETESSEDPAPEAPKRRRRTRCRECGELHFKDEPCEFDTPTPGTAEETMTPKSSDPFADFF